MLKIIHSSHGGGKTTYLLGAVKSLLESGKLQTKPIYIVPEQAHFETERGLYYNLGAKNIKDIEITTFTKLTAGIVSKLGEAKPYCDDTVKLVTMMKCISSLKASFVFYTGRTDSKNIAAQMLALIENFKREGITDNELADRLPYLNDSPLHKKICDIALIYKEYNETLNHKFADKLDDTLRAAAIARETSFFSHRQIFFDGFDGFSGSQRKMIGSMISDAAEVLITIGIENYPSRDPGYRFANTMVKQLIALCDNAKKSHKLILTDRPRRQPENVELVSAPDVYLECDYIAAKIHELVSGGKYSYNDIAVLVPRGAGGHTEELMASLGKYDICAFADLPSSILDKPIIRFILTVLEAAAFKGDGVLNYIKSGFIRVPAELEKTVILSRSNRRGLDSDYTRFVLKPFIKNQSFDFLERNQRTARLGRRSINELCRIACAYNIKGRDWKKSFPQRSDAIAAEPLRREIIDKLIAFSDRLKPSAADGAEPTGDEITRVLSDFLINELEFGRTILAIANRRNAEFKKGFQIDKSMADEYRQIWDIMITVLESMHSALVDYPISLEGYTEMLRRVLSDTDIARPPQVLDAVTVGDTERSRSENKKIVFIMGALSGVFPGGSKQNRFFKADELDELIGVGIELSEDRQGRVYRQRYIADKAISAPSEFLILTAPQNSLSYEPLEFSPIFGELADKYKINIQNTMNMPLSFFVRNLKTLRQTAARNPKNVQLIETIRVYDSEFADSLCRHYGSEHEIFEETANKLLQNSKRAESPTSVGYLSSCPFCYFCRYGLSIFPDGEVNPEEPDSFLRGSLIHSCLEQITKNFKQFISFSDSEIFEKTKEAISQYIQNLPYNEYTKKQTKYLLNLQREEISNMLVLLRDEFKGSPFSIIKSEHPFSYSIGNIKIKGRIDRIDALDDGAGKDLRIVDYKSGKDKFDWDSVYYGMNLQILLYLFAAEQDVTGFGGIPSGAYIKNTGGGESKSAVFSKSLVPTEYEAVKNQMGSRRMSGVQLLDCAGEQEINRLKDHFKGITGESRAEYIAAKVLTAGEYQKLKDYIGKKLSEQKADILSGKIPALPIQKDKNTGPCDWCDYSGICGNDGKYIKIEKGKTDKIVKE